MDALKLIAQEIIDRLGQAPTHMLVPTGAGPLVKGIVQGFRAATMQLARCEGILTEPTGVSSVTAVRELTDRNEIDGESRVVCMVTGHGFKDMQHYHALSGG